MEPLSDLRRGYKRPRLSEQESCRELLLKRQKQSHPNSELHELCLASTLLSLPPQSKPKLKSKSSDLNLHEASKLKGLESRKWFATQLMLPAWMIDVLHRLHHDWYVFPRPAGKRCLVVSCDGTTVSRQRNGSILHHFSSALPNGARNWSAQSAYTILDCIFHEMDQTYYVIDMVCWRDYSFYNCTFEFRLFWLKSMLGETGALKPPSYYHNYRFSLIPVNSCNLSGLYAAYTGAVPYVKDGLLFYNKHAHYQLGNTPLALVWKDETCSRYVVDTDKVGQVSRHQQVVLQLRDDAHVTTSDDPPVVFGCLDSDLIQKMGLESKCLVRFAVGDGGLSIVDGKLERADLHYLRKSHRARAFADSYSKVVFQSMVRGFPLKIDHLVASISSDDGEANSSRTRDVEMMIACEA